MKYPTIKSMKLIREGFISPGQLSPPDWPELTCSVNITYELESKEEVSQKVSLDYAARLGFADAIEVINRFRNTPVIWESPKMQEWVTAVTKVWGTYSVDYIRQYYPSYAPEVPKGRLESFIEFYMGAVENGIILHYPQRANDSGKVHIYSEYERQIRQDCTLFFESVEKLLTTNVDRLIAAVDFYSLRRGIHPFEKHCWADGISEQLQSRANAFHRPEELIDDHNDQLIDREGWRSDFIFLMSKGPAEKKHIAEFSSYTEAATGRLLDTLMNEHKVRRNACAGTEAFELTIAFRQELGLPIQHPEF